jgi:hypothetical protein
MGVCSWGFLIPPTTDDVQQQQTTIALIYFQLPSLFKTFPFVLPLSLFSRALISEWKAMLFSDFVPLPVALD